MCSVFVVLPESVLRSRWFDLRASCWSVATWKTRRSQWKKYLLFCEDQELEAIPASVETVCLYISFLTFTFKYSSITNYVSAIWILHQWFDTTSPAKGSFLVKCTMLGARRLLGSAVTQMDPLMPDDLLRVFSTLSMKDPWDVLFWCIVTLSFRCLLRKSHLTASPHVIQAEDVSLTSYGLDITINSSKTIQFKERKVVVPIIKSSGPLCPIKWIRRYRRAVPSTTALLCKPGTQSPPTYVWYLNKLRSACKTAGLSGHYGSHSLRRGSATFLSRIGMPLHDIRIYGDWRSLSVLLYLSADKATRYSKDKYVSHCLSRFI